MTSSDLYNTKYIGKVYWSLSVLRYIRKIYISKYKVYGTSLKNENKKGNCICSHQNTKIYYCFKLAEYIAISCEKGKKAVTTLPDHGFRTVFASLSILPPPVP